MHPDMVIYDLSCQWGHQFEGWFPNLEAFEFQKAGGHLTCQVCGDSRIDKLPSAAHVVRSATPVQRGVTPRGEPPKPVEKTPEGTGLLVAGPIDQVTIMKALRHYVKSHFENVNKNFATLAREMHTGEIPPRNIYGEVTREEAARLAEEEIPHLILPDLPPEFEN